MSDAKLKNGQRAAALLMVICILLAGLQGTKALLALPYWQQEDWQETMEFDALLYREIDEVMILVNLFQNREAEQTYMGRQQLRNSIEEQYQELRHDQTWFRFCVKTADGEPAFQFDVEELNGAGMDEVQTVHYATFSKDGRVPGEGVSGALRNPDEKTEGQTEYGSYDIVEVQPTFSAETMEEGDFYIIECGVTADPDRSVEDDFYELYQTVKTAQGNFTGWLNSSIAFLIAAGVLLLILLVLTGKAAVQPDFRPAWTERLWLEPFLLVTGGIICAALVISEYIAEYFIFYQPNGITGQEVRALLPWAVSALLLAVMGMAALILRTLVVRICRRGLWRSTMLCRGGAFLARQTGRALAVVPILWKGLLAFVIYVGLNTAASSMLFQGYFYYGGVWKKLLLWLAVNLGALWLLCRWLLSFRRLRDGARTLARGNLDYQIDTRKMPGSLREHGEDLNNISQGMSDAVDRQMKSERFKAELITNVSHDLKTPLTSIINYVDLLKTTDQTDPRAVEYIGVLERKSLRLKKLTEDLVEASKASTGVLSVHREKIGMAQLLDQAMGEWEEKLNDRKLTVVTTLPEGELWVCADGRHLWRVIDNLLSNCCKYAMEGTRIYIDLSRRKGQVELAVKNISREQLNLPPEQLLERFVRGEASRSTEGSGLGLSIARSLTELQGGTFSLTVDGDLFKATVSMPQAN